MAVPSQVPRPSLLGTSPLLHERPIVGRIEEGGGQCKNRCKNIAVQKTGARILSLKQVQKYYNAKNITMQNVAGPSAVTLFKEQFRAQIATFVIASLGLH